MDLENAKGLMMEVYRKTKASMEAEGELTPTFFIGNEEGLGILPAQWRTDTEKDMYSNLVRQVCKKISATFILFVSETWVVEGAAAEDFQKNRNKYEGVKDHPLAREVISLFYEGEDGFNMFANVPITRKEDGKPILGELKIVNGAMQEGRFANFLQKAQKPPEGETIH